MCRCNLSKNIYMRQNVAKNFKCGHFCCNARGNAKLMINFVWPYKLYCIPLLFDQEITLSLLVSHLTETSNTLLHSPFSLILIILGWVPS